MRLDGKIALVTGGGRNLGRAMALALARAGASVAVSAARSRDEVEAVAAEIAAAGARAMAVTADLADPAAARDMVAEVRRRLGPVSVLVNNAAVRPYRDFLEITPEEWEWVTRVNQGGPFFCAQAALPDMLEARWGRIINVSGADAYWGSTHRPHVTATKGALIGFTRALALEYAPAGITVNAIVPGIMDTSRKPEWYPDWEARLKARLATVPMGRQGASDELSGLCVFLASDASSYVTGQAIHVNGGAYMS